MKNPFYTLYNTFDEIQCELLDVDDTKSQCDLEMFLFFYATRHWLISARLRRWKMCHPNTPFRFVSAMTNFPKENILHLQKQV